VKSVEAVAKKGESSGGGALAGAVIGGVAGHQLGEGRGNDAATIIGVVGGALAGNAIEKNAKKKTEYVVVVAMDDGRTQRFTLSASPGFAAGDKVKVVDGGPVRQ
jgi:outer membrane lipoprotein SlyB